METSKTNERIEEDEKTEQKTSKTKIIEYTYFFII